MGNRWKGEKLGEIGRVAPEVMHVKLRLRTKEQSNIVEVMKSCDLERKGRRKSEGEG